MPVGAAACPGGVVGAAGCGTGVGWVACGCPGLCTKIVGNADNTPIYFCQFSEVSYLSVSVTSSISYPTPGPMQNFVNFLNAYWAANPTFNIPWNTHQGQQGPTFNKCDGAYDTGPTADIASYWVAQIGMVNGLPVWAFETHNTADGHWTLTFTNGSIPGTAGGIQFDDPTFGNTCLSAVLSVAGGVSGSASLSLTVKNNVSCCCNCTNAFLLLATAYTIDAPGTWDFTSCLYQSPVTNFPPPLLPTTYTKTLATNPDEPDCDFGGSGLDEYFAGYFVSSIEMTLICRGWQVYFQFVNGDDVAGPSFLYQQRTPNCNDPTGIYDLIFVCCDAEFPGSCTAPGSPIAPLTLMVS